jgi:hypothetical protein
MVAFLEACCLMAACPHDDIFSAHLDVRPGRRLTKPPNMIDDILHSQYCLSGIAMRILFY